MANAREDAVGRLHQHLLDAARPAGWGYYRGKASRIEPTCWALLALIGSPQDTGAEQTPLRQRHVAFLSAIQRSSGLLVETDDALANLSANGVALAVLPSIDTPEARPLTARLRSGLVGVKGVRLPQSGGRQDDQLQGWPWVRDTFSWVEPTAWCLLGLKRAAEAHDPAAAARVAEAEKLLLNRVCTAGGWNYGNANTLGQDLRPYVPTTAIALLAMQDRGGERDVNRSAQWLFDNRLSEPSTIALSLASLSLKIFGFAADDVDRVLMDAVERSESSGHVLAVAMAAYALSADRHNVEALRVPA
jgi:hypothetical protein